MDWSFINNVRLLFYCKMIKQILFILFIILLPFGVFAQTSEEQKIVNKINKFNSEISSIECDFVQTKHLQILNDKMVSYGKMYYQQPDKLRWEYKKPYTYVFILNGTKVYLKKESRNDVIDIKQNKVFKSIAEIMMNSVIGKCLTNNKEFKVSILDVNNQWVASLIPQKKELKQMYSKIILYFGKANSIIQKVEMIEKNGDKTIIELKNVKLNKPVNANSFS